MIPGRRFALLLQTVSAAIIEGDIAVRSSVSPGDVSNAFFSDNPVRVWERGDVYYRVDPPLMDPASRC